MNNYNKNNIIYNISIGLLCLLFISGCCIPIPYIQVIDLKPKAEFVEIQNKVNDEIILNLYIPELSYNSKIDIPPLSIKKWQPSILEHGKLKKNIFIYDFEINCTYNKGKSIIRKRESYRTIIKPTKIDRWAYPIKYKIYFYRIIIIENDIIFDVR